MKKSTFVRRLSAWLMAAVMLLSTVPAMAAFRDTAGHWAEKTLTEWQDKGLIDGYGDGSFQPDGTMTRAEFAKLVNRTLGFTAESAISFSDVTERDWFYAEVARAVAAGYAQGSGGMFRPNQAVTRAEAAAMLARALDLAANEERANAFTDAASIPAWAKGSVGAAAEAGCMTGYPDGTFGASGSITRAEAVVTLDRVLKSAKETVIEKAGTTLENKTIPGDLIIAESVGEGNVTLKNVTVLGSVIVKGGGANSIYFDGVQVNGAVRLQKENVHLRLMGDTALDRVEIGLPCRITQDSTFKGALGTLVIDLEKTSNQKIQIEVPAKLVELLSRANVALNADVETLQIGKDAEGAQLDIKRGVTVGELSIDARVALTGSGLVVSLVVSVSGVTVSGSLTVKKTETEGGAKAPTISGGSSSGGGVTLKEIESIAPITAEVPYGTSEAAALAALPAKITLNVKDGSTVSATVTEWNWADSTNYEAKPAADTAYTATTAFTVPSGYTYSGTLTAAATVTVKALDTRDFNAALKASQALVDSTVTDEAAAAADPANKILITSETSAANITKGVRFTTSAAKTALTNAVTAATTAQTKGFASQQACDDQTKALTAAVDAFTNTLRTGTSTITDGYILQQVNSFLVNDNPNAPFASSVQPLKLDYIYPLPTQYTVGDAIINLSWEASGEGMSYITLGSKLSDADDTYGAKVTSAPGTPKEITFTAKVTRTGTSSKEIGSINYTATVGAPISVSADQPKDTPKIAPITPYGEANLSDICTVQINLNGAEAIKSVRIKDEASDLITMTGVASSNKDDGLTTIYPELKRGTVNNNGLNLTISIATAPSSGVWNPDNDRNPVHNTGRLANISIKPEALELYPFGEDNPGWYLPTTALNSPDPQYHIDVYLLRPAYTSVQTKGDNSQVTVTLTTQYMPKDVYFRIALAPDTLEIANIENSSDAIKEQVDGTAGVYEAVFNGLKAGTTYKIWCQLGIGGDWVYTETTFPQSGGKDTP